MLCVIKTWIMCLIKNFLCLINNLKTALSSKVSWPKENIRSQVRRLRRLEGLINYCLLLLLELNVWNMGVTCMSTRWLMKSEVQIWGVNWCRSKKDQQDSIFFGIRQILLETLSWILFTRTIKYPISLIVKDSELNVKLRWIY